MAQCNFLVIDFEGEPSGALSERGIKRSPLRDVASMIRSFHYAAHTALLEQIDHGRLQGQAVGTASWARYWSAWVSAIFFKAYRQNLGTAPLLPARNEDLVVMLDAYLLSRAIYELGEELDKRPEWVKIPLEDMLELLQQSKDP